MEHGAAERVVAFDVETPNWRNDRMSAIGIAVIEQGRIVQTYASLVNPQTHFDAFNVALTGITPEMAERAPAFPALWETVGPLLQSGLLLAHNASFDMRVLATCLRDYGIAAPRYLRYACTVQMGRRCYPSLINHKLDTLCRHCGIELDHHKADSDSRACAELLLDYLSKGMALQPFIRTYDMQAMCTLQARRQSYRTGPFPR